MKRPIEDIIIAFFEGQLSEEEKLEFAEMRNKFEETEALFQEYKAMFGELEEQELVKPNERIKAGFERLLATEKQHQASNVTELPRRALSRRRIFSYGIAASIILLIGLGLGIMISNNQTINNMNEEMALLRSSMNELLRNESTSMRIKAVNLSYQLEKPDEDVLEVLLNTMNNDESENVRIAAINALGKFAHIEKVKKSLITALEEQKNSYIQIKLIQILSQIQAKEALPSFEQLLKDEKTSPFVKTEAQEGKTRLLNI